MTNTGAIGFAKRDGKASAPRIRGERGARTMVLAGIALIGFVVIFAILAPWVSPWGPIEIDASATRAAPGGDHLLGTDVNGMDVLSRLAYAARVDLLVAVIAVVLAVIGGAIIGVTAGYAGGWFDSVMMRLLEIVQSFPTFILALAVAALLGPGIVNLTIVVAVVSIPSYARLIRAEVRTVRELAYVDAARTSGISTSAVLWRHVLPNSLTAVRIVAPLNVGWAMLALAGLSFLGLGVPIPEPEWGAMISQGTADLVSGRLWTTLPPGIFLVICVLGFSLLGEGLQERENRRRTR